MNQQLGKQQREVDRLLADLSGQLECPGPSPRCLAGIKAAVSVEAERLLRRQRLLASLRPWVGAAAALLLMVGWSGMGGSAMVAPASAAADDPEAIFTDWVDALGESGEQFTMLVEESWLPSDFGPDRKENGDEIDPFDTLEESLESLERVIGA